MTPASDESPDILSCDNGVVGLGVWQLPIRVLNKGLKLSMVLGGLYIDMPFLW